MQTEPDPQENWADSNPIPTPAYVLGAKVRYRPYHQQPEWPDHWHPEPHRVIGRGTLQMMDMHDRVHYVIQPWILTGVWMQDRPYVVEQEQLQLWEESC